MARRFATDTHCANDHEFTAENTYVHSTTGRKVCKVCQRNAQQRYHGRPEGGDAPVGTRNRDKTRCAHGHLFAKHGYVKTDGSRGCRVCHRDHYRRRTYGVDPETFQRLQAEGCGICRQPFKNERDTHHDHDHTTGFFRGLLCGECNLALGKFKDDIEVLRAAVRYLQRATRSKQGSR